MVVIILFSSMVSMVVIIEARSASSPFTGWQSFTGWPVHPFPLWNNVAPSDCFTGQPLFYEELPGHSSGLGLEH